jgi:hypothetical protein
MKPPPVKRGPTAASKPGAAGFLRPYPLFVAFLKAAAKKK